MFFRFGRCLQHAGVAITVTSLTDFLAFVVGATTVLPALQSFCVFCGVGILFVFFLQCTWFVSWMVIDERRIQANRYNLFRHGASNQAFCLAIFQQPPPTQSCRIIEFLAKFLEFFDLILEFFLIKILEFFSNIPNFFLDSLTTP